MKASKITLNKNQTIVVNLKEGIALAAHRHRANPKVFHPHFKSRKSSSIKTKLCKKYSYDDGDLADIRAVLDNEYFDQG